MARIIRVGAGGSEIGWHEALKDLQADDVILLEPGYYELPQGLKLTDVTVKGMGASPEDTTILGYLTVSEDSHFVNLENLCINTNTDHNSLFVPTETDGYLSLRNCSIKGAGTDTAAIAANGKVTLELYSTQVTNGSVSMFANADFRLEMNDSVIDYPSEEYCALALEGKGTAIINNSHIHGSTNTFTKTNAEVDINNSSLDYMILHGQTWLNMLNSTVKSFDDAALYISDDCWVNIVNSRFNGGIYFDQKARAILQNCTLDRLIAINEARITMTGCQVLSHADFQDQVEADATRVSFNGNGDYEYFLALNGKAHLAGHNLILNANGSELAIKDNAKFNSNVLASDQTSLEIECQKPKNVHVYGLNWTAKRK
ncbi:MULTISPECIES: hypothetical protein [Lactobacillus]|uniref:Right handed beta helix domain-containing protein n=1 Tax=Lactobacillus xujianguonis TaxID=2495899 RepID=A0A437SUF9_9LACO|nr:MULTISPECIES: hypothetical protein [Lactobacillus]RVU70524.1 hypothetical protein EJK17_06975 [Lactobacillus xujianguonis]RVU77021.1 hypothetical protein EJK20_02630 [Lactobacillus xujianguonis]